MDASLGILFAYDAVSDQLVVAATSPRGPGELDALTIVLGERLSGWVAANRRTIVNSDPALDIGDYSRRLGLSLNNTLALPLVSGRDLLGVLSLYREDPFSDGDRVQAESLGRLFSTRMMQQRALSLSPKDQPSRPQADPLAPVASVLCIEILNWADIQRRMGADIAESAVTRVGILLREALSPGDLLVRNRDEEFVALLATGEAKDIRVLARHLRKSIWEATRSSDGVGLEVAVDVIMAPSDSAALSDLLPGDIRDIAPKTPAPPQRIH